MLRSGELLQGKIQHENDRYIVIGDNSEVTLPAGDVDFVCNSLDEAYRIQQSRAAAGKIDDHLNLAAWCLRHELLGYAGTEIAAAMAIDPQNRRLDVLDRRLQLAIEESARAKTNPAIQAKPNFPVSGDELERLIRSLPAGSAETFTATIQPMLLNYCATAGCHGATGSQKYILLRPALGKQPLVRVTQRNLYNTLQWVDYSNPAESKLLKAAAEPHGDGQLTASAVLDAAKCQQLSAWVMQVGQRMQTPAATSAALMAAAAPPVRSRGVLASRYSPPGSIDSAVAQPMPINPKAVLAPQPRIVQSVRAMAANTKTSRPQSGISAQNSSGPQRANQNAPARAVSPTPPISSPLPPRNGDEIPNASEVLP
jgi:hypothetical protein